MNKTIKTDTYAHYLLELFGHDIGIDFDLLHKQALQIVYGLRLDFNQLRQGVRCRLRGDDTYRCKIDTIMQIILELLTHHDETANNYTYSRDLIRTLDRAEGNKSAPREATRDKFSFFVLKYFHYLIYSHVKSYYLWGLNNEEILGILNGSPPHPVIQFWKQIDLIQWDDLKKTILGTTIKGYHKSAIDFLTKLDDFPIKWFKPRYLLFGFCGRDLHAEKIASGPLVKVNNCFLEAMPFNLLPPPKSPAPKGKRNSKNKTYICIYDFLGSACANAICGVSPWSEFVDLLSEMVVCLKRSFQSISKLPQKPTEQHQKNCRNFLVILREISTYAARKNVDSEIEFGQFNLPWWKLSWFEDPKIQTNSYERAKAANLKFAASLGT